MPLMLFDAIAFRAQPAVVECNPLIFVINHGQQHATMALKGPGNALLGNYNNEKIELAPMICILLKSAAGYWKFEIGIKQE